MIPPTVLPPGYARWLDAIFPEGIPEEKRATCSTCVMIQQPGQPPPDFQFHPQTKCCTYYPDLTNFLVGAILADDAPEAAWAKDVISVRIQERAGVTPLGIVRPPLYGRLYSEVLSKTTAAFGRMPGARCPFYITHGGGQCGIWKHRNGVCTTWFCKYDRAVTGKAFWKAMLGLLTCLERALSQWALLQMDLPPRTREILAFLGERPGGGIREIIDPPSEPLRRALWGPYHQRERELYIETARLVSALSWDDVLRVAGPDLQLFVHVVKTLHARRISDELPARVHVGRDVLMQIGRRPGTFRVAPRALGYDALEAPVELIQAVPRLASGDLADVLAAMAAEGKPIDPADVRRLLDYQVLVTGEPSAEAFLGQMD